MDREPALSSAETLASDAIATAQAHPTAIGHYRIIRLVGAGGMGAVYEAEQEHPRRVVALKVIKPALVGTELLRRFDLESQVLGRLQHPGIAQIYEAGTADQGLGPQPYFAMEFIRGLSLCDYAQAHRSSTRDRLELIVKICDAVHHAHQRGVIHRDLKPANILVDESGQPKILDFGVARCTDSDGQATRQTDVGQIIGTLAYMSPEQVLADPLEVDTRSDVYALGVILYELLSGRLPYTLSRKLHEAVQTIRQEEPAGLSSVDRAYRGDIETIVAKALEKDKNRRYSSAAGLAVDVRHYLRQEPITARPPNTAYQLRKFALRHKALVGALAAVFAVLLLGVFAATWEALRAERAERAALVQRDQADLARRAAAEERDRAVRAEEQSNEARNQALSEKQRADTEAATAKAVNEFLEGDLLAQASAYAQAGPSSKPDPDLTVRTALDRAAARIEGKFDNQPIVEGSIRQTIGSAYMDLGLYPQAQQQLQRALSLRRRALGEDNKDTLTAMSLLTKLYRLQGKFAEAEPLLRKVLDLQKRSLGETHDDTLDSMNELAILYRSEGKYPQAETLYLAALKLYRSSGRSLTTDAAAVMQNLGSLYRQQGRYAQAEPLYLRYVESARRALGPEHPDTLMGLANLASLELTMGRYEQAESRNIETLEIRRRVLGPEHPDTLMTMANLAEAYRSQRKYAEAEPLYVKVAEIRNRVLGPEHPDTLINLNNQALMYLEQQKYAESEGLYLKVLDIRRHVLGEDHPSTLNTRYSLALLYRNQGKYAQSAALLGPVVEARRRVLGATHPDTLVAMIGLATVYLQDGKYVQAEGLARDALSAYQKANPDDWRRFDSESRLGASLAGQKQYDKAEEALLAGYEGLEQRRSVLPAAGRSALQSAGDWIVGLYRDWGKTEKAEQWAARLSATRTAGTQN